MTALLRLSAIAALLASGLAPGFAAPAAAQDGQVAITNTNPAGRCGQPFALTHLLAVPLDLQPAAPFAATVARFEPVYLEFSLTSPSRTVLRTSTSNSSDDPVLALYDSTGTAIGTSDDDGGNFNALIDTSLQPGTYCAQVRLYGNDTSTTPVVTLQVATGDAAEALAYVEPEAGAGPAACSDPSMTADLGRPFGAGFGILNQAGFLADGNVADWRLTVTDEATFGALASSSDFDTTLTVFDAQGGTVLYNDDGPAGGTDSSLAEPLAPGDYCLRVASFGGTGGSYSIEITDTPSADGVSALYAQLCADPALTQNLGDGFAPGLGRLQIGATVAPGARQDFTFSVAREMPLQADARSAVFDTVMTLVRDGRLVDQNDDGPSGTDSRITTRLAPGAYCLSVQGFDGTGGAVELAMTDLVEDPALLPPAAACTDPAILTTLGQTVGPGLGLFSMPGQVAEGGRSDFAFDVTAPVMLQIDARSTALDTILSLTDAGGGLVAENDDGPVGSDSRVVVDLQPGRYCLRIAGYDDTGGPFEIAMTDTPEPDRAYAPYCGEPSFLSELPFAVGSGMGQQSLAASIAPNGRADFGFTVTDGTPIQFDAGSAALDTVMKIADASGNLIAENDDRPDGSTDSQLVQTFAPGRYCLAVEGFGGAGGDVQLTVSDTISATGPGQLSAGSGFCAGPTTEALGVDIGAGLGSHAVSGAIGNGEIKDYTFFVTDPAQIRVRLSSQEFDTYLKLADEAGFLLAENDDSIEGGTDSDMTHVFAPGAYCLRVESFGGAGGAFTLALGAEGSGTVMGGEASAEAGTAVPTAESGVAVEDLGSLGTVTLQPTVPEEALTKWLAFSADIAGPVTVAGVSPSGPFIVRLFHEDGTPIAEGSSFGGFSPAVLRETLEPGRYFVSMTFDGYVDGRLRSLQISRE